MMKKRLRRLACLLAALAVCLALPAGLALPAAAQEEPVELVDIYFMEQTSHVLPTGGDPRALDLISYAAAKLAGARFFSLVCDVEWDYASLDVQTPGYNLITGRVVAPEGYAFSCDTAVTAEVAVWDPAGEPFDQMMLHEVFRRRMNMVVPLGMDAQALQAHLEASVRPDTDVYTQRGKCHPARVTWDASLVDTSRAGAYYPFSLHDLPPFVDTSAGMPCIYVADPDTVDMGARIQTHADGRVAIHWLPLTENTQLWCRVNGGEYILDPGMGLPGESLLASFYRETEEDIGIVHCSEGQPANYLQFRLSQLLPGNVYELQIRYGEGQTSVNTLEIDTRGEWPVYKTNYGGDPDGGDQEEDPKDIEQPAPGGPGPAAPATPADGPGEAPQAAAGTVPDAQAGAQPVAPAADRQPAAARPLEQVTTTRTAVSGLRLAEMVAAQPAAVLFQKQAASLRIPSDWLAALNLSDNALFDVEIAEKGGRLSIGASVDGQAVDALPGAQVVWALSADLRARIEALGLSGDQVAGLLSGGGTRDAAYDAAAGTLTFTVDAPGSFSLDLPAPAGAEPSPTPETVLPAAPMAAPPAQAFPLLAVFLPLGAALAGVLCLVLLRRARLRRVMAMPREEEPYEP